MRQCTVVKLTLLRQVVISPAAASSILATQRSKMQEKQVFCNMLQSQQTQLTYQIMVLKYLHSRRMPNEMVGKGRGINGRLSTTHWVWLRLLVSIGRSLWGWGSGVTRRVA